jgi:hypothetical protein
MRLGVAWLGEAGPGVARPGRAWRGEARLGKAWVCIDIKQTGDTDGKRQDFSTRRSGWSRC